MNCVRIQESFLDLEAGILPETETHLVRTHLQGCPTCQREWADLQDTLLKLDRFPVEAPSARLRIQFYAMLDTHLRGSTGGANPFSRAPGRIDRWIEAIWPRRPIWQLSVALLLLTGGVVGGNRIASAVAKPTQVASAAQLAATQNELAELRARVDSVNQLVSYSLSQQQPAHDRLQHVVATLGPGSKDEHTLAELLSTLAFDPSTNVRLSALESLYASADDATVRQGVRTAFPRETSPLVQVAMIDFLASVRDSEAVPVFQQIAHLPTADQTVRIAAQRAIAQL